MAIYSNGQVGWKSGVVAPTTTLNTSIYAAYNFDNNLNDSVGSKNGTGFGGISYGTTSGLINTSVGFNGTNAYVTLPNNTGQFNFTDDFSISLWVKPFTVSADVFLIANYTSSGSNNYGYYLYLKGNQSLRFGTLDGANASEMVINQLPAVNIWSNITITRKNSTTTKMYINNVLMTPTSYSNPTLNPSYQSGIITTLGAFSGSYRYSGWMDSLDFWTKELTTDEVSQLYNSGAGKQYSF
jgi:hypothetical protein